MEKSVYVETYGCSNNQAESQMMKGLLEKSGFRITDNEEAADIVVVNTCSVKNKTESKIMHRLSSFHEKYRDKKLIVAGCLPEARIERVRKIAKNASIVGTNHIRKIAVAADLLLDGTYVEFVGKANVEKIGLPKIRENDVIDIIPISCIMITSPFFHVDNVHTFLYPRHGRSYSLYPTVQPIVPHSSHDLQSVSFLIQTS